MFKKFLSIFLAVTLCFAFSVSVIADEETNLTVEEPTQSDEDLIQAAQAEQPPHVIVSTNFTEDDMKPGEIWYNPETGHYRQRVSAEREAMNRELCSAPDEVLAGSTLELLEYFTCSPLVIELHLSSSSKLKYDQIDFARVSEPFQELLTRDDLSEAVTAYAKALLENPEEYHWIAPSGLEAFVQNPAVQAVLNLPSPVVEMENVVASQNETITEEIMPQFIGEPKFDMNGVSYEVAAITYTITGHEVELLRADRELYNNQIAEALSSLAGYGGTLVAYPSAYYNCHSYAWYDYSVSNPYWVEDISPYLMDSESVPIPTNSAQVGDIIVYYDIFGNVTHSGVVTGVTSSGEVMIRSKWGQGAVYDHTTNNVPRSYYWGLDSVDYEFFRYHGYHYYGILDMYTGENYHSGSVHYYQFADYCRCGAQTGEYWISMPCTGPTCVYPWALPPTYEEM